MNKKILIPSLIIFISVSVFSCGSPPPSQTNKTSPSVSYSLSGSVTGAKWLGKEGVPCDLAESAYQKDLGIGSQVKVENAKGEVVAVGKIVGGSTVNVGGQLQCSMKFAVANIPESNFYSVTIGDTKRGKQTFSKDDLVGKNWTLTLSLDN